MRGRITLGWVAALLLILALGVLSGPAHAKKPPKPPPDPADPAIAFTSGESFNRLKVMDEDGSNVTEIARPEGGACQHKSWSPDGASLAYQTQGGEVWRIDIVVTNGVPAGQNITLLRRNCFHPAWSPSTSANEIAVSSGSWLSIQLISAVDGQLLRTLYTVTSGRLTSPSWNADATKLAFIEITDAGKAVRVLDPSSGGVTTALAAGEFSSLSELDWARDADLLVFQGTPAGTTDAGIYQLDLDSGDTSALVLGSHDDRPTWSPDGALIAFDRRTNGGNWEVRTLDLETGDEVRLSRRAAFAEWRR